MWVWDRQPTTKRFLVIHDEKLWKTNGIVHILISGMFATPRFPLWSQRIVRSTSDLVYSNKVVHLI